jgi:hypothetical protein
MGFRRKDRLVQQIARGVTTTARPLSPAIVLDADEAPVPVLRGPCEWGTLYVTAGLSKRQASDTPAEVLLVTPPGWPALLPLDGPLSWPVAALHLVAALVDGGTALTPGQTLVHDGYTPLGEDTRYCGALLHTPRLLPDDTWTVKAGGRRVGFLALYPLLEDELQLRERDGSFALYDHLDAVDATEVLSRRD